MNSICNHYSSLDRSEQLYLIRCLISARKIQKWYKGVKKNNTPPYEILINKLKNSEKKVKDGYGDYIVYSKNARTISKGEYKKAYVLIQYFSRLEEGNRTRRIKKWIKNEICPDLDIAFIPKTLFELMYIRATIEEELDNKRICFQNVKHGMLEKKQNINKVDSCWHQRFFSDTDFPNNFDPFVVEYSFRINQIIQKRLNINGPLYGEEILKFTDLELDFFKNHKQKFPELLRSKEFKTYHEMAGTSINFAFDKNRGAYMHCFPMGFSNESDCLRVKRAIALECDSSSINATVIYRGGDLTSDRLFGISDLGNKSLSYNLSPYACCMYDESACVAYHTTKKERMFYAITIPNKEIDNQCPFLIPQANTAAMLMAKGETVHVRTKIFVKQGEEVPRIITGIYSVFPVITNRFLEELQFNGNEEQLHTAFKKYISKAVRLSPFL